MKDESAALGRATSGLGDLRGPVALDGMARWHAVLPWAWMATLLSVVVLTQIAHGAYRAELGNYSDESAHFLNALVLRDYLTQGLGQSPLAFAEAYYLSYPKIAPLVWPPFFHATLGLFLLPGWAPHQAAVLFVGLVAALAAFRLSRFVLLFSSPLAAALFPALFLLTPMIVDLTSAVMVDIALVALGLEAAWWLAQYFVFGRKRQALMFGLVATCCCLTKGNGVAITLLPGLLMLCSGQVHLLRRRGLYVAAIMVALFAGPFVFVSYRLCNAMGDFGGTGGSVALDRAQFFLAFLWRQLTPVPFVLAAIGAAGAVYRAWVEPPTLRVIAPAALVALSISSVLFHVLLPLEWYSGRYVATAITPLLALAPLGAAVLLQTMRYPGRHAPATAAVLGIAAFSMLLLHPAVAVRRPLGYTAAVNALAGAGPDGAAGLAGRRILVISDELGEGALVSEVAIRSPSPAPTVIRGSKLLIDGDWMGNNLQMLFGSADESMRWFEDLHLDYLVVDQSPEARDTPYWSHVHAVTQNAGARLHPVFTSDVGGASGPTRALTIYRVVQRTPGPPAKLRLNLRYSLGKFLER